MAVKKTSKKRIWFILTGVQPGDEIISGNYLILSRVLEDGDAVRIRTQHL